MQVVTCVHFEKKEKEEEEEVCFVDWRMAARTHSYTHTHSLSYDRPTLHDRQETPSDTQSFAPAVHACVRLNADTAHTLCLSLARFLLCGQRALFPTFFLPDLATKLTSSSLLQPNQTSYGKTQAFFHEGQPSGGRRPRAAEGEGMEDPHSHTPTACTHRIPPLHAHTMNTRAIDAQQRAATTFARAPSQHRKTKKLSTQVTTWWARNKQNYNTDKARFKPKFALKSFSVDYPHFTKPYSFKSVQKLPQWFSQIVAREIQASVRSQPHISTKRVPSPHLPTRPLFLTCSLRQTFIHNRD